MKKTIKSMAVKAGGNKTFYVNSPAAAPANNDFLSFFSNGESYLNTEDLNGGSSWGIPSGTIPVNAVNQILAELSRNNPFFLDKVRIKLLYTGGNSWPNGLNLAALQQSAFGDVDITTLPSVQVIDPNEQQSLIYDFSVNMVIDGSSDIIMSWNQIPPATFTGFVATFYVSAIADVYEMETV